jgi:membrane protein
VTDQNVHPTRAHSRVASVRIAVADLWSRVLQAVRGSVPWRTFERLDDHGGIELAGNLAFTAILALFPFLIFLVALAGFIGDADAANRVIGWMFSFLPSEVANALAPVVKEVLQRPRGGLLTFGVVGTLWVASSGIEALRTALNRAYRATESRPFWLRRLQSVAFVLGGAVIMILVSGLIIVGGLISDYIGEVPVVPGLTQDVWNAARLGLGAVLLGGALFGIHRWLPGCDIPGRRLIPGIVLTTAVWIAVASFFTFYLDNVGRYDVTYGSLGGAILTLFFFYVTALIFMAGAELNAVLINRRRAAEAASPPPEAA